jgi:hypothetical protein
VTKTCSCLKPSLKKMTHALKGVSAKVRRKQSITYSTLKRRKTFGRTLDASWTRFSHFDIEQIILFCLVSILPTFLQPLPRFCSIFEARKSPVAFSFYVLACQSSRSNPSSKKLHNPLGQCSNDPAGRIAERKQFSSCREQHLRGLDPILDITSS